MMPWFIWKGKNSLSDFGLWINKLPDRIRPAERYEEIVIPGRAGSLLMLEGEDVYGSFTAKMTVWARNTLDIDGVTDWLRGSSDLILCTDPNKARYARIVGDVTFKRTGPDLMQATIPFFCTPFRKNLFPEQDQVTITSTSGTVYNPGDVASRPVVRITRNGGITVTIASQEMEFRSVGGTITVDCDAQIITTQVDTYDSTRYYTKGEYAIFSEQGEGDTVELKLYQFTDTGVGSTLVSGGKRKEIEDWDGDAFEYIWPGVFFGDFWKIPKGESTVTKNNTGTIVIDPNWRWL